MRKFLMGVIAALIAIAVTVSSALAANAATAGGGDSVTVESVSYAETSAKANVKTEALAVIDGATQLTWEEPNHTVKVTAKQLKKAVRIKVNATGANSSKVVFKTAVRKLMKTKKMSRNEAVKASRVVILKAGSCVRNRGRLNNLPRGFEWCPDVPVVLKYDTKSDQYRHSHSLLTASNLAALKQKLASEDRLDELEVVGTVKIGGVTYYIVKWCLNYIGGDVVMLVKVVQVRFVHNLLVDVELESSVDVSATVKASLQCPSGTLYGEASASASGYAAASIRVKMKDKDASVEAEKSRILAEARIKAKTAASAAAQAKVKLECGSTPPPPPVYQAPSVSGQAKACVKPGQQTGVITASGVNPNDVAAPGTLTIGGQTKQFASVGAGQTVTWDFSGFAPGNYQGTFTLGSPINKSATFSVTVAECVYQNGSILEVVDVNDVRYGSDYYWRIRGMVPDGQSAVLRVSSIRGTVRESDKSIQLGSGAFDVTIKYTAPSEGSSDTLTAKLFGPDGVLDDEKSDTFDLLPHPVDPL